MVNWTLGNKFQWNFHQNATIFIQENAFENVVWKMAADVLIETKLGFCSIQNAMHDNQCGLSWQKIQKKGSLFSQSKVTFHVWTGCCCFCHVCCCEYWQLHYKSWTPQSGELFGFYIFNATCSSNKLNKTAWYPASWMEPMLLSYWRKKNHTRMSVPLHYRLDSL